MTCIDPNLPKGIEAKLEPLQEGREYQVRVDPQPRARQGSVPRPVTIHTDSPKVPTVEVPFKGTVI